MDLSPISSEPGLDHRLGSRKFIPYFLTQALGAFNDNAFRFAVMFLLTYQAVSLPLDINLVMNLAAGLFILPYLLFSSWAGRLADQMDQAQLARRLKWLELGLMLLAATGFILHSGWLLLALVFAMGAQSALFGPLKYAILPRHLERSALMRANGWVSMGTFMAILLGTLTGGLMTAAGGHANLIAGLLVVCVAAAGLVSSQLIPPAPPKPVRRATGRPKARPRLQSLAIYRQLGQTQRATLLMISWFWFLGAGYLTQFPNFARTVLGAPPSEATALLALFAIGIGCGALGVGYLSGGKPRLALTPLAAVVIALAAMDWFIAARHFSTHDGLLSPNGLRIAVDILVSGVAGGVFTVPLYSYLQRATRNRIRARVIAALNVFNAVFMVASALLGMILFGVLKISLPTFFLLYGSTGLMVAMIWWSRMHRTRRSSDVIPES